MNRQQQIDAFTLAAHRRVLPILQAQPHALDEALQVLGRWREIAGAPSHSQPYWDEWSALLRSGVDAVERAVCIESDHAATLRSVSPLGRFLPASERHRLLRQARAEA